MVRFDRNLVNLDIVNYKIVHGIYASQVIMADELQKSGLEVKSKAQNINFPEQQFTMKERSSFKDLFVQYCSLMESRPKLCFNLNLNNNEKEYLEKKNPLIKEAYEKLGKDEVKRLKYHQGNIKRELVKRGDVKTH